jgi:hypothetical protein
MVQQALLDRTTITYRTCKTFNVIICTNTKKRLQYSIKSHVIIDDNMEIDDRFAIEHIHKWIRAWNDHNLREVISLYSENISFSSPKIKAVYPNRDSSTITNKKDLEEYFYSGLKKFPMFHFTPIDYFLKNDKKIHGL